MTYDKCTDEMDYEDCVLDHSQSNPNNNLIDKNDGPSQQTLNFILSYSKSVKHTSKDKFLFSLN